MTGRHGDCDVDRVGVGTDGRFQMEVVTLDGRASAVEFRIRRDSLEVWFQEHCCTVVDRDQLRAWLASPGPAWVTDEVAVSRDADGRVAFAFLDVGLWALSPMVLAMLRERV